MCTSEYKILGSDWSKYCYLLTKSGHFLLLINLEMYHTANMARLFIEITEI